MFRVILMLLLLVSYLISFSQLPVNIPPFYDLKIIQQPWNNLPESTSPVSYPGRIEYFKLQDNKWVKTREIFNTYDLKKRIVDYINFDYESNSGFRSNIYYENDKVINSKHYYLKDQDWILSYRDTILYDIHDNISRKDVLISPSPKISDSTIYTYTYDSEFRIINQLQEQWSPYDGYEYSNTIVAYDDKDWFIQWNSYFFYYNSIGSLDSIINGNNKYIFLYNTKNYLMYYEEQNKNSSGIFAPKYRYTSFQYSESGKLIRRIEQKYDNGQWVNKIKYSLERLPYNGFHLTGQKMENGYWINDWRLLQEYDYRYNLTKNIQEKWINGQWEYDYHPIEKQYIYDRDGHILEILQTTTDKKTLEKSYSKIVYSKFFEEERPDPLLSHIYPNPTKDFFLINIANLREPAVINIFDIMGRVVLSSKVIGLDEISVSHLQRGTYIIVINNGNERIVKKLVKM